MRTGMPGRGDLPGGCAPGQVERFREDQLRVRRRGRRHQQPRQRVRDRSQRAESAARVARYISSQTGRTPVVVPEKGVSMPKQAWSAKRERQYKHVKHSEKKRGRWTRRAKQIAAATVNKERARERRVQICLAQLDQRHLIRPARRASLRRRAEGPHQGAALQRGEAPRDQRTLEDEQGAATARRCSQDLSVALTLVGIVAGL